MIFDNRPCDLGEGPLWHPMRQQLFWFDITGQRMLSVEKGEQRQWLFPEMVSAAGWVDRDMLLIAGERDLFFFDVETEEIETLALPQGEQARHVIDIAVGEKHRLDRGMP
jgi:sugar lactone lactonase YvrE